MLSNKNTKIMLEVIKDQAQMIANLNCRCEYLDDMRNEYNDNILELKNEIEELKAKRDKQNEILR